MSNSQLILGWEMLIDLSKTFLKIIQRGDRKEVIRRIKSSEFRSYKMVAGGDDSMSKKDLEYRDRLDMATTHCEEICSGKSSVFRLLAP